MSEENIAVARQLYPGTVDVVAALAPEAFEVWRTTFGALMHPDLETVAVPGQLPLSGAGTADPSKPTYHGLEGFAAAFRDWLSAWETWVVTPADFIAVDESRVLVLLDVRARSKTHQVEMPIEGANLVTIRGGKLARLELFFDRGQALEASGLRE